MARILLVLSGSDHWTLADGTRHPTGYWAEEFVAPHRTFVQKGLELEIATPGGVRPTVDEASLAEDDGEELRRYLESVDTELARPLDLAECARRADNYDAVYVPGGHGPMEDLPGNPDLGRILTELYDSGRIVAAMCHGPAGLLSAVRPDGGWVFAGRRMTAFTDEEERMVGLADKAPWLLEDTLRSRGAVFEAGPAWEPYVVVDANLVTGQNPASSQPAADATLDALHVGRP
ncbi:MAG TPA: type 1 glutamine amidotransferase domain-containing protein [Mycobacteriales bacterium]|jgi:putative intracellular protease/amidase|nr:type 1 glutamine amidotransferase domain-containing protein [Mycobacteriales bacterium]